jgi:hypothetical protein
MRFHTIITFAFVANWENGGVLCASKYSRGEDGTLMRLYVFIGCMYLLGLDPVATSCRAVGQPAMSESGASPGIEIVGTRHILYIHCSLKDVDTERPEIARMRPRLPGFVLFQGSGSSGMSTICIWVDYSRFSVAWRKFRMAVWTWMNEGWAFF